MVKAITLVTVGVFVAVLTLNNSDSVNAAGNAIAEAVRWGMLLCAGTFVFVVGVGILWWLRRSGREDQRQRDGAFPVREYWLEPWTVRLANTLRGRASERAVLDINMMLSPVIISNTIYQVEPACGWDRQLEYSREVERTRRVQAAVTGDGVRALPWAVVDGNGHSNGVPNAATGRYLAGAYDPRPRPAPVSRQIEMAPEPSPPVDMPLAVAVQRAESQSWPVGFAPDGTMATFNPISHAHAAIVGSTGTGKTTGAGFVLAAHALRNGYHVVVLDADDGAAWTPFNGQAERVDTDATNFADQMQAIHTEFERRAALLHAAGAIDISQIQAERRILCVLEEYGDMIHTLQQRAPKEAAAVEAMLDTLLRRGRKAGVHMVLIDQYPEYWSQQIIAGTKFRAVFQLGPNQGAKLEEYKAAQLSDRGAFYHRGREYRAWHAAPQLRQLLASVPAASLSVLGGRIRSVHSENGNGRGVACGSERSVAVTEQPQPNAIDTGPTDLQAAVWAWRDANPDGTQAELRKDFAVRHIDIARGYAHECWHRWPGVNVIDLSTDNGRAAFASYMQDARLPSGARFGTDISTLETP